MRVAILVRTSTRKQEGGLKTQVRTCRAFIKSLQEQRKLDVENVRIYKEEGVSGRSERRQVLDELLKDAAMKRFRALVVFRLDRLSRRQSLVVGDVLDVVKRLHGYGVRVYSASESWWDPEDSPVAPVILAVMGWAAAMESRAIADRVSAGIADKKAAAAEEGVPFLWGRARSPYSVRLRDPAIRAQALALRAGGASWTETARALGVGRTTARGLCVIAPTKTREFSGVEEGPVATPTD